ncbi:polyphosphate kinase 2 [Thioalkalicoccus limnaeus]|uniref:ADP/GDP-polyphosphate phosphotransferase n=1 Tax=Thioalkalicoccus limnaeus TaxID=120681 RepID=A0ABV4BGH1_9GAMM
MEAGGKRDILDASYPYDRWMKKRDYEAELAPLQIELAKCQHWIRESGARLVVVFEGRDGAGKGGAIGRVTMNLNPRIARIVALSTPTERERRQWYFQRYIAHLPSAGEMTLFDRSWYNRGVIEKVFGFCGAEERARFFAQLPGVEQTLISEGIILVKLWLDVGRAEQLRRLLRRETDPLRHWKLSRIDVEGLALWDAYSEAIAETFRASHTSIAPWTVIRGDDKYRARLTAIRAILGAVDYDGKDGNVVGQVDPKICGGPEIWLPG